jgi:hypothetical protein
MKTPEEKLSLMEGAYTKWLQQKKIAVEEVGFDPVHPLFAGWNMGFNDGYLAYTTDRKIRDTCFLILGMLVGVLI